MTDQTNAKPVTFEQITKLGQKRVNDTRLVDVPALGGTVKLRQLSGADQDAAIALGQAGDTFDAHIVAREQIKRSLVEPALPEAEADALLDNLPVKAFGELQALVQANSGLLGIGVEELVRTFRLAADASGANEAGSNEPDAAADAAGVGDDVTDPSDGMAGVPSMASDGTAGDSETPVDAGEAVEEDEVNA